MNFKNLAISFMVFALFTIALISFGVNFGTENDAVILITDNNSPMKTIYTGVNDTISNYNSQGIYKEANDSFNSFNDNSGTGGILGSITEFFIKGILTVGKGIMGIANGIFNVTFAPILKALGIPNGIGMVIGAIISSILLFSVVLMAWRLYRSGE